MNEKILEQQNTPENQLSIISGILNKLENVYEWGGSEDKDGLLTRGEPDYDAAKENIIKILPNNKYEIEKIFKQAFFSSDEDPGGDTMIPLEADFEYAKYEISQLIKK